MYFALLTSLFFSLALGTPADPPLPTTTTTTTIAGVTLPYSTEHEIRCAKDNKSPLVSSAIVNFCAGPYGEGVFMPSNWASSSHYSDAALNSHFGKYMAVRVNAENCKKWNDEEDAWKADAMSVESCRKQFFKRAEEFWVEWR
ncbi:uncharacterized protein LTR77_005050 [Saxophila tyrrhenica]|uniref:Uncharacterized protein n=1 Tax=Saxophila tyrrhenica TaxID=1690608 RepID=A0AAV9PE03_9PEZI|nr:hypothetical protein LTR77_005050 [Saxophila tyrrhenica]